MTQAAVRSPAGMHGQSLACNVSEAKISSLPAAAFFVASPRFNALRSPALPHLLEANVSKRPFTRPQRLFSFENHRGEVKRSRPISSTKF